MLMEVLLRPSSVFKLWLASGYSSTWMVNVNVIPFTIQNKRLESSYTLRWYLMRRQSVCALECSWTQLNGTMRWRIIQLNACKHFQQPWCILELCLVMVCWDERLLTCCSNDLELPACVKMQKLLINLQQIDYLISNHILYFISILFSNLVVVRKCTVWWNCDFQPSCNLNCHIRLFHSFSKTDVIQYIHGRACLHCRGVGPIANRLELIFEGCSG